MHAIPLIHEKCPFPEVIKTLDGVGFQPARSQVLADQIAGKESGTLAGEDRVDQQVNVIKNNDLLE